MAQPHQIEMRGISISFGGFNALQSVDFTLRGGSVHALTGANGAGKINPYGCVVWYMGAI